MKIAYFGRVTKIEPGHLENCIKGRQVFFLGGGGTLSTPVRKSIKEVSGTPFCYLEFINIKITCTKFKAKYKKLKKI